VIAEALKKKTSRRYETSVFAHLYAGKSSPFFYRKWQTSYRNFGRTLRDAHSRGYLYIADFDLTAFYDSIDHKVLRHFLKELGIDEDTIDSLLDYLRTWTSSTWSTGPQNIYHGHGIPQGPLASGMLSEAVLLHIDQAGEQGKKTIYLRYVDDIKILAKTEDDLRRKLIKLDIASKEIGLFPQTSKINIRKLVDPDKEIKSVSRPPEPSLQGPLSKHKRRELVRRILELSRGDSVTAENATRFKYLMGRTRTDFRLNSRLMKLIRKQPELSSSVCGYIERYKSVPRKMAEEINHYIQHTELYHSVNADLLRACIGRLPPKEAAALGKFSADRLLRPRRGSIQLQPSYKEALICFALSTHSLTFAEYEPLVVNEPDWWVSKSALRCLEPGLFGKATYDSLINKCLRIDGEISSIAAARLLQHDVKLFTPYGDVAGGGKRTLKAAGKIRSVGRPVSLINEILAYMLGRARTTYDWKRFFGSNHRHAELMMIFLKKNRESNIDAFLVQLDSFCDFVVAEIFRRLLPAKTYPAYGSAIKNPTLVAKLPITMAVLKKLHDVRLQSTTAHPEHSGKPTRRLKHRDFYKLRGDLIKAFNEFEATIPA
jgi:hypothetical protein